VNIACQAWQFPPHCTPWGYYAVSDHGTAATPESKCLFHVAQWFFAHFFTKQEKCMFYSSKKLERDLFFYPSLRRAEA
jgi:hypothetical protein